MTIRLYKDKTTNALYEAFPPEEGTVRFWTQGGGFERKWPEQEFTRRFDLFTENLAIRPGTVTAGFLPENTSYPCYSGGQRWNGWGCPLFDEPTVRKIVEDFNDLRLQFRESDKVVLEFQDGDGVQEISAKNIQVGDKTIALYEFEGWTWDAVEFDNEKTTEEQSEAPTP